MSQTAEHLTADTFTAKAIETPGVALVDFWAEWCPPCRALGPTIDQLASDTGDRALVGKVNVDEAKEVARQFNVSSIPTVIVFKDGREVERLVGLRQIEDYQQAIDAAEAA